MFRSISFLLALLCPVRGIDIDVDWGWDCIQCKRNDPVRARVGDVLKFDQGSGHNVYTMVDAKAYADCDFAGGTDLGADAPVDVPIVAEDAGKTLYFGCQIPSHCSVGSMSIAVEVRQKKCEPIKMKAQNKREYETGNEKTGDEKEKKTCKWLIRKIKRFEQIQHDPEKFIKMTCKKSSDPAERVAAKVCSCACKMYEKEGYLD